MELNGRQLVHAAASKTTTGCENPDGPGHEGSGKSSTSLACLLAGMDFLGDDYLAVALDPQPRVYRLYSTAKLDRESLDLYPELRACGIVLREHFSKAVLYLEDEFAEQLKESLPLQLVLRPSIAAQPETAFAPIKAREIESAFSFETLLHLPHAGAHTVAFLDRLAREVPRAAILLGRDRPRIPAVIQESLHKVPANSSELGDHRPAISVLVHFHEEDREELAALAAMIVSHDYPRAELSRYVRASRSRISRRGHVRSFPETSSSSRSMIPS